VVRWEMRTRLFLRTAEFLWQEGHTAHSNREEAIEETERMLNIYADFAEKMMAIPMLKGLKPEHEKFAGAEKTYCIEAMTQDKQAIQAGTSHYLAQNFAKAFDVKFQNKEGQEEYVYATSWGVSTRLIGTLLMAHSDDEGIVMPPKLAPTQVVIIPLTGKDEAVNTMLFDKAIQIKKNLIAKQIRVKVDDDETKRPGFKFAEYELQGIPIRLVLGARDMAEGKVELARRDTKEKFLTTEVDIENQIENLLETIQQNIYDKALQFRNDNTFTVDTYDEFKEVIIKKGGFVMAHWDGTTETADKIKEETKATIRCILLDQKQEDGKCIYSGAPSKQRVVFALNY
jgi:prolyl-tRNA synthetase